MKSNKIIEAPKKAARGVKKGLDSIVDVGNQAIPKVDKHGYDALMGIGALNPAAKVMGAKRKVSGAIAKADPKLAPVAKGGGMLDDLSLGLGTKLSTKVATSDLFQKLPAPSFYKRAVRDNAKRMSNQRAERPVRVGPKQVVRKSAKRTKKK